MGSLFLLEHWFSWTRCMYCFFSWIICLSIGSVEPNVRVQAVFFLHYSYSPLMYVLLLVSSDDCVQGHRYNGVGYLIFQQEKNYQQTAPFFSIPCTGQFFACYVLLASCSIYVSIFLRCSCCLFTLWSRSKEKFVASNGLIRIPSRDLTRLKATNVNPRLKSFFPMSTMIFSLVQPCDLCTVTA